MRKKMITLAVILLTFSIWVVPSMAEDCECTACHGNVEDVHGNYNHAATPGGGTVAIFADNDHDEAGWTGSRPFFAIPVDCTLCHYTDLPAIHGNDCATCHPTPYGTDGPYASLGVWERGCQQGECHASYHENVIKAHDPFSNTHGGGNDCYRCHDQWSFAVQQTYCLNCHVQYVPGDATPPVTTSNAKAAYVGPAEIQFSMTDNGKVGMGRTFYRLNDGAVTPAGNSLIVTAPGLHQLQFWSKDQSGNTESAPNSVFFTVAADTIPPTTTSDAKASYLHSATITLTATDNSNRGVKTTYYRLNGGATKSGNQVFIPGTNGVQTYTLTFWSEDWSGNQENQKSVNFTVTSGNGTLRLIWGNSDLSGSPCAGDPEANASWTVRKGGWWGPVVASGFDGCPGWSGFNDIAAPVSTSPYFVIVEWWDSSGEYYDESWFGNIYVNAPGQIIRLGY